MSAAGKPVWNADAIHSGTHLHPLDVARSVEVAVKPLEVATSVAISDYERHGSMWLDKGHQSGELISDPTAYLFALIVQWQDVANTLSESLRKLAALAPPAESDPPPAPPSGLVAKRVMRWDPWTGDRHGDARPLREEAEAAHLALAPFGQMGHQCQKHPTSQGFTISGYAVDAFVRAYELALRNSNAVLWTARHGAELLDLLRPHVPAHLVDDFNALRRALTPDT